MNGPVSIAIACELVVVIAIIIFAAIIVRVGSIADVVMGWM